MTQTDERELRVIQLNKDTDLSTFSCSEPQLNEFLIQDSLNDHENLYSITHLVLSGNEIAGFFTLITDNLSISRLEKTAYQDYHYQKLPAIKVARLATAKKFEGKGIGRRMIIEIYKYVYTITKYAGCRLITVDAKQDAVGFYQKFAFRTAAGKKDTPFVPMYLDFKPICDRIKNTLK
ncbi:MAG TPA: GNAT family N-acetyltransferase [Methanocorpusculum sp.]|nr:GNAT family N-acetyltransferase [Methanocorpusculum sp.]